MGTSIACRADEPVTPRVELHHDLRVELPATAALAVVVVGWRLVRDDLEPSHCRWCDGSSPGSVNAVDDWFRTALKRNDTQPANVMSYVLAFGAAPVSAAGLTVLAAVADDRGDEALVDVVAVAEGGLTAMLVTELLEPLALRTRPYVHAIADDAERDAVIAQTGAFHSFPAGHVVEAFGLAAASGVVASMRGYRLAPLVWAAGLMFGVATAYTRIAADRHYFTDTLAGAAIGLVAGALPPLVFHRPVTREGERAGILGRATLTAMPVRGGQMVGVGWLF
jgi:membrane-associated phospholipid phosphatase